MLSLQLEQGLENKKADKIYGFDYLRAVCCLMVVGLHTNLYSLFNISAVVKKVIFYNLLDLAVPIFFQIALVLFFINREKKQNYFINKRLPKLLQMYFFWGLFSHIFYLLTEHKAYLGYLSNLNGYTLFFHIIQDGYGNPFYFFFSLLFITFLSELFAFVLEKLKVKNLWLGYVGMILSCGIVLFIPLSILLINDAWISLSRTFNPLNFIPYVFSSWLISRFLMKNQEQQIESKSYYIQVFIIFILYLACAVLEWKYLSHTHIYWDGGTIDSLPIYTRISLVFGACFFTLIALQIQSPPNFIVKSLSDLSLGIFCLHTFVGIKSEIMFMHLPNARIVIFLTTLVGSIIMTKVFKKIPLLRDYV